MATRSLTDVFILMRNNALRTRHIFYDQADDQVSLVSRNRREQETAISINEAGKLPPEWIDGVEETQYEISRIKHRMKDLNALHDKHLNRPTMDDNVNEEHEIDIITQDITQMFTTCQRQVHTINTKSMSGSDSERHLSKNIVNSLARTLQEMSTNFRKSQSSYLRRLKSREERSKEYFDTNLIPDTEAADDHLGNSYYKGFTEIQLQAVEDNSVVITQREQEIKQVVRSIYDLNEIFKDLGSLIVDQGTILDRIDFNIETSHHQVERGLQQLQKAEKHQKKSRKMIAITVLAAVIILLIIILIAVKG